MSIRLAKTLLLFLVIALLSPSSFSDDRFEIRGDWKFQSGDNPDWKNYDFDDSQWKSINVPKLLFQRNEQPVVGWYRVNFDVLSLGYEQLALYIETIRHSDETWVNGVKIGGKGKIHGAWDFMHTNPQSLPRLYQIPDYVLKEKNNVLAIRFNTGFGEAIGAMFPGGAGITKGKVFIGDYYELLPVVHKEELSIMMIDSFFAVLGMLDLLIIAFLIKTALGPIPEFKWLLATSFFLLLGTASQDVHFIYSTELVKANFLMMLAMLVLPYTTAMYFWSQDQSIPSRIIIGVSLLWGVSAFVILWPSISAELKSISWYLWQFTALLLLIYSLYVALKGVIKRRTGAIAQLLGLVICVVFIRSQWLPEMFFGHRNIQIGGLFYRYALLVAYFQQMAHVRLDYKKLNAKLIGVVENVQHSIARELHDGIGQHLASARLQAKITEKVTGHSLSLIEQELDSSIVGMRRLINGLHPVSIAKTSLVKAIHLESKNLKSIHKVEIKIDAEDHNLDKNIEMNLFRIFQECANNAIKHGEATEVAISIEVIKRRVILIISDNGKGFVVDKERSFKEESGYGLVSMNERVTLLNGTLEIKSHVSKGTTVRVLLPLVINQ